MLAPAVALAAGLSLSMTAQANAYTVMSLDALDPDMYSMAGYAVNAHGQVAGESRTSDWQPHAVLSGAGGSITDLGTLGGQLSRAYGINDSGQVIGYSFAGWGGPERAFITGPGGVGMTDLGTLDGHSSSRAYGINASGQVVGYSYSSHLDIRGFVTGANGVGMTNLGTLGGSTTYAYAINDSGQAVGYSHTETEDRHAFIFSADSGMTDLGTLGGAGSFAYGINASGQVIGNSHNADGLLHAFVTGANGVGMIDLGTLGGVFSNAYGINASGQVVGAAYNADGNSRAFVTGLDGTMIDLNTLVTLSDGEYLTGARAINDLGQIVAGSNYRTYLLTPTAPVPEPETYAMLLAGLGLVGFMARRRARRF